MRCVLALAAVTALTLPTLAAAHVTVAPPFVNAGIETEIAFQTPNERVPHATVSLSTTAPPGVRIVSASAPPGWSASVSGSTATWTDGRSKGNQVVAFRIRIDPHVGAGTVQFTSVQGYDDAETVRWKVDLSVLPATGAAAPKQHIGTAIVVGVAGVVVIGMSLLALAGYRRRRVGSELLRRVPDHVRDVGGQSLYAATRSEATDQLAFLAHHGLVEVARMEDVELDLDDYDAASKTPANVANVRLSPELEADVYAVALEADADVPAATPISTGPLER